MRRLIVTLMLLLSALFSLQACNTLQGMGQDLEEAGQEIDEEI